MKTETRYIADDGIIFYDEYECWGYEMKQKLVHLHEVKAYKNNVEIKPFIGSIPNEWFYNGADKIIISSKEGLKDLHNLSYYCGWISFEAIKDIGIWIWDNDILEFKEITNDYESDSKSTYK